MEIKMPAIKCNVGEKTFFFFNSVLRIIKSNLFHNRQRCKSHKGRGGQTRLCLRFLVFTIK